MATTQKSVQQKSIRPPHEITGDTKARRAWLASALAGVLAEADTDKAKTKIVGVGSYQAVSVWKLIEVAGRERFRGICQFCGRDQVVSEDRIALHGYQRPGHGFIVGSCPESNAQPLNSSDERTRYWVDHFAGRLPGAIEAEAAALKVRDEALAALKASGEIGWQADNARPRLSSRATSAERAAFDAKMAEWAKAYPCHAASNRTTGEWQNARNLREWIADMKKHLGELLAAGIVGTPLTREVVA